MNSKSPKRSERWWKRKAIRVALRETIIMSLCVGRRSVRSARRSVGPPVGVSNRSPAWYNRLQSLHGRVSDSNQQGEKLSARDLRSSSDRISGKTLCWTNSEALTGDPLRGIINCAPPPPPDFFSKCRTFPWVGPENRKVGSCLTYARYAVYSKCTGCHRSIIYTDIFIYFI